MSTSGGTILNAVLYMAMLLLCIMIAKGLVGRETLVLSKPAVGLWLLVAIPSLLQFAFLQIYSALRREPDLIRHHGQWWRVLTSVVVQDGGVFGTTFNLVVLAVIATVAVQAWGGPRTVVIFIVAQLLFGTMATFLSSDIGAGNSGATFGLATSVAGLVLIRHRRARLVLSSVAVVAIGVVLLVLGDAHGIALMGGVVIGVCVALIAPPQVGVATVPN